MSWYLDTSAAAKLVDVEQESSALRTWLADRRWSLSDLHRTELRRAAGRAGPEPMARAQELLATAKVVRVDPDLFDAAGLLGPPELRSLDALHLAAAQTLGPDLAGIVAYDRRLLAAARAVGIEVASPGMS